MHRRRRTESATLIVEPHMHTNIAREHPLCVRTVLHHADERCSGRRGGAGAGGGRGGSRARGGARSQVIRACNTVRRVKHYSVDLHTSQLSNELSTQTLVIVNHPSYLQSPMITNMRINNAFIDTNI